MARTTVDLAAHINKTVERGGPADFPVVLKPVLYRRNGSVEHVPKRLAVVREDTGEALAVVSSRYTLVPHQRILDLVQDAVAQLDVGPVPRGVFVDRKGARMRALFKFHSLTQAVLNGDEICPCLKVQNTYDGTSRVGVHIGAFRFVCTNLAVGGGGAFAGGFMAVHAGEIPIEEIAGQLASYLGGFDTIVETYRSWSDSPLERETAERLLESLPKRAAKSMREEIERNRVRTVYDAYNAPTRYATHEMRSARAAFNLMERINRTFQERFSAN